MVNTRVEITTSSSVLLVLNVALTNVHALKLDVSCISGIVIKSVIHRVNPVLTCILGFNVEC